MQEVGGGQRCPMQMSGLKGDETNLARRRTMTASKFPWSGRRGPAGGETGQEGRGQGQVLPQNRTGGGGGGSRGCCLTSPRAPISCCLPAEGRLGPRCSNSSCPTSQVRSYSIREREREFKGTCPFDTAWRLTKAICARQGFSICLLSP